MRRFSEIQGDEAFEVLADLLDPIMEIAVDEETRSLLASGNRIKLISTLLKKHKKPITRILAILDGEDPETYKPTLASIPIKLIYLFNDPVLVPFFQSQGQNTDEILSGSASGNTEE